jgi:hypothetical protein
VDFRATGATGKEVAHHPDSSDELRLSMAIQLVNVPALVEIGVRMHALTRCRSLDYKPAKVAQMR